MENNEILKRIGRVMQVEATVPTRRDFLLTHVPFRNLSLGDSAPISEQTLFEEKLLANPEDHKTIMILGENGSGKSHLIRWLYEQYVKVYGKNNEVEKILWISKAHNTLQDALMQLLKSDVFPEEIRKNELEKVKNAQSAISGVELRKTINFNFTLVIEDDIANKCKSAFLDPSSIIMLASFLKNQYILDTFLMRKNGPLDRICSKLNNVDNSKTNDFEGEVFTEADFAITLSDIKSHLEGGDNVADSYTILLAKKLMNNASNKFRKNVAAYMNSKVDEVIQKSLSLTTSDFKLLFQSLRTKLKERRMRLTLFVEDVNAFTGIDSALMDVLFANHQSQGNEDYCRLCSVVGSTNDFYRNRLNGSFQERVEKDGAKILIREESLFGDEERLTEFAAKYINACLLTEEQVELWEKESDCDDREIPIASNSYEFSKVMCFGKEMTIFPFNKTAICNMYEKLDSMSKTPRRLLLDVVYPVLKLYYSAPDEFLDNEAAFRNDSITSLNAFSKPRYVKINDTNVGGPDAERRSLLLRVWGNATTEVKDDKLAGLDKEVFDAFGVDMMLDKFKENSGVTDDTIEPKAVDDHSSNNQVKQKTNKSGGEVASQNNVRDAAYTKIRSEIGGWAKNPNVKLNYAQELRTLLSKFIYGNMSWDVEEIPQPIIEAYINTVKYISIEGQNSNIREDGIIVKRSQESEYLFYALIGYKYLGNNSWIFEDGIEYYNLAMTWLLKHHNEILKLVKAPYENVVSYREVLVASIYSMRLMNGGVVTCDSPDDMMLELFKDDFVRSSFHSEKWNSISQELDQIDEFKKYRDLVVNTFSNAVGTADVDDTKYTFVDAHRIITIISKLIDTNWDITKYAVQSDDMKKQDLWFKPSKIVGIISKNIPTLVAAEMKLIEQYTTYFRKKIPNYTDVKQVEQTLSRISDYLKYLTDKRNLGYTEDNVRLIRKLSSAQYIVSEMSVLDDILLKRSMAEKMNSIAQNPFEHIETIYEELQYFDQLIKEKNEKFKSGIDVSVNNQIEQYRKTIKNSLEKMISVGKGV